MKKKSVESLGRFKGCKALAFSMLFLDRGCFMVTVGFYLCPNSLLIMFYDS